MNRIGKLWLYWSPRALGIAFAIFLSLFALDVFQEGRGLWQTALALTMHLVPVFIVVLALILAWRWEWIGAVFFTVIAALYLALVAVPRGHLEWALVISGPALILAALFFANWLKRAELRARS